MRKFIFATLLVAFAAAFFHHSAAADQALLVPAPAIDAKLAKSPGSETAILSGGCFWGACRWFFSM
jgi:hypothetical protein